MTFVLFSTQNPLHLQSSQLLDQVPLSSTGPGARLGALDMTRGDWQKSAILNSCSHYTQSPSALFQDNQEGDPQNSRDPVGERRNPPTAVSTTLISAAHTSPPPVFPKAPHAAHLSNPRTARAKYPGTHSKHRACKLCYHSKSLIETK